MNIRIALAAALLLAAAAPGPAAALTCYFLIDRNDNVVYRDTYPPVDLSAGAAITSSRWRAIDAPASSSSPARRARPTSTWNRSSPACP